MTASLYDNSELWTLSQDDSFVHDCKVEYYDVANYDIRSTQKCDETVTDRCLVKVEKDGDFKDIQFP